MQPRKNATPWAYNASFLRKLLEEAYIPDYFEQARFWLVDTEADDEGRKLQLIDLQTVAPMSDRDFRRRIAALRTAWRTYLTGDRPKRKDRPKPEDQPGFEFD